MAAARGAGGNGRGGAIATKSALVATGCMFANNTNKKFDDFDPTIPLRNPGETVDGTRAVYQGGAIFGEESGSVWLEDTEIISCRSGRSGGAISLNYMGDVSLINSTIKGCHASKRGGALHMRESGDVSLLGSACSTSKLPTSMRLASRSFVAAVVI